MINLEQEKFKNPHCQACIKKNIEKYGSFNINCDGIQVDQAIEIGKKIGMEENTARWMYDTAYFFGEVYKSDARDYQIPIMNCTAKRLVGRQCRQTGKSLAFVFKCVHFAATNKNKTVLILAPNEKLLDKLWDEYIFRDCIDQHPDLKASVSEKKKKPAYQVKFDNGSKIILLIANENARGQTGDIIYIDEAAMIPRDTLNSIMMTIASKAGNAYIYLTSTPMGRGNYFFKACKEYSQYNEFHVSIDNVPQMADQRDEFLELLGEQGFIQECLAEFPDTIGGPFNFKGIDLAKTDYKYPYVPEPGALYFAGVDWNGPNVGTYFYIVAFYPDTLSMRVVDKAVIASTNWNSIAAKQKFIELNRKWNPKHWMCDYGYGHSIVEELRAYSITVKDNSNSPNVLADKMIKHIIEPVEFGSFLEIEDPFTKEETKKTTKSFVITQVSKLFEPKNNKVPVSFSAHDRELVDSLENYKLLQITDRGVEKYGFDKKDGFEDHAIDAFTLAIYGIIKHYSELFKKVLALSRLMNSRAILQPPTEVDSEVVYAGSIVLLTDNNPEPIMLDERKIKDPTEREEIIVSRSLSKGGLKRKYNLKSLSGIMRTRGGQIKRSLNF